MIPKFNATRWNSELKSFRGVSSISYSDLTSNLSELSLENIIPTKYEYDRLKELVNILTPFEEVTDMLQGKFL